jgi:hypothetical protein
MPKGKKEVEELASDDGTILIPADKVPEVSASAAKKMVKRPMSEKQMENAKKLGELAKARWAAIREQKEAEKKEAEERAKEEKRAREEEMIKAGTHVRVRVREKGSPRNKVQARKPLKPLPLKRAETAWDSDTSDTEVTETETETEVEDVKPRRVRKEVKKTLRTLEKVDQALSAMPSNPYMAMLQSRWV